MTRSRACDVPPRASVSCRNHAACAPARNAMQCLRANAPFARVVDVRDREALLVWFSCRSRTDGRSRSAAPSVRGRRDRCDTPCRWLDHPAALARGIDGSSSTPRGPWPRGGRGASPAGDSSRTRVAWQRRWVRVGGGNSRSPACRARASRDPHGTSRRSSSSRRCAARGTSRTPDVRAARWSPRARDSSRTQAAASQVRGSRRDDTTCTDRGLGWSQHAWLAWCGTSRTTAAASQARARPARDMWCTRRGPSLPSTRPSGHGTSRTATTRAPASMRGVRGNRRTSSTRGAAGSSDMTRRRVTWRWDRCGAADDTSRTHPSRSAEQGAPCAARDTRCTSAASRCRVARDR